MLPRTESSGTSANENDATSMPKESDDYVCKAAKTVEEARQLVEEGFDYVTEIDDVKLFRKRK